MVSGPGSTSGIDAEIWSAPTEFQIVLGNGLHVAWARAHDFFEEIPWQVTFNELLLPIPQQALPFPKLDAGEWYIQQLGFQNHGLMFGVVAQSDLGFGLPEMIVRGAVLGAILAFIHRFCVRNADRQHCRADRLLLALPFDLLHLSRWHVLYRDLGDLPTRAVPVCFVAASAAAQTGRSSGSRDLRQATW